MHCCQMSCRNSNKQHSLRTGPASSTASEHKPQESTSQLEIIWDSKQKFSRATRRTDSLIGLKRTNQSHLTHPREAAAAAAAVVVCGSLPQPVIITCQGSASIKCPQMPQLTAFSAAAQLLIIKPGFLDNQHTSTPPPPPQFTTSSLTSGVNTEININKTSRASSYQM